MFGSRDPPLRRSGGKRMRSGHVYGKCEKALCRKRFKSKMFGMSASETLVLFKTKVKQESNVTERHSTGRGGGYTGLRKKRTV